MSDRSDTSVHDNTMTSDTGEAEILAAADLGVFYTLLHYFAEDGPSAAIREAAQALRSALCVPKPAASPLPSLPWWWPVVLAGVNLGHVARGILRGTDARGRRTPVRHADLRSLGHAVGTFNDALASLAKARPSVDRATEGSR